jgi:hypothetical protein
MNTLNNQPTSNCKPACKTLRNGERGDLPELMRLTSEMLAERGALGDVAIPQFTQRCHEQPTHRASRRRLPDRRASETFELEAGGLRYTATLSWFADGRIGELFLCSHKSNSAADTTARDAAITFSIAVQHGADAEVIRRALCRDSQGRPSGPLAAALDAICEGVRK